MLLRSRFEFSAAHQLPRHPGACRRMHGHNYQLEVSVGGPVDRDTGMVMDFFELERLVRERVLSQLDHVCLNEIIEYPTAENIARWSWRQLAPVLPGLVELAVFEMPTCAVIYRGEDEH